MTKSPFDAANDNASPRTLHPAVYWLLRVAGANPEVLRHQCPEDIPKVLAQLCLLIGTFIYSSVVLTMIGNRLFAADHFSFGLMLGAIGVSALISAADAYVYLHCSWLKDGISELHKIGWDIPLPRGQLFRMNLFLGNRLVLAAGWAVFIGISLSLIIFASDIKAHQEAQYLKTNSVIVDAAGRLYDAQLRSQAETVATQEGVVKALAKQVTSLRQNEVSWIVRAGQRRGGAAVDGRIGPFEARLEQEQGKLDAARRRLAELTQGRNAAIRQAVDSSPNRVPFAGDGFLAQVKALDEIAAENPKVAFLIAILDLVAIGVEFAPILAKLLGLNPTLYSAIVARDYFLRLSEVGKGLEPQPGGETPPEPPTDAPARGNVVTLFEPMNDNVAAPTEVPKRKRGRPRKLPPGLNGSGM